MRPGLVDAILGLTALAGMTAAVLPARPATKSSVVSAGLTLFPRILTPRCRYDSTGESRSFEIICGVPFS